MSGYSCLSRLAVFAKNTQQLFDRNNFCRFHVVNQREGIIVLNEDGFKLRNWTQENVLDGSRVVWMGDRSAFSVFYKVEQCDTHVFGSVKVIQSGFYTYTDEIKTLVAQAVTHNFNIKPNKGVNSDANFYLFPFVQL